MKPLVFISYCHTDKDYVRVFTEKLKKIEVQYFLDQKKIQWGDSITDEVRSALNECIAVVVIISPASLKSQWVPFEIGHALGANAMGVNKKILPLLTHPSLDIPAYLKDVNCISEIDLAIRYFQSDDWKEHICEESQRTISNDLRLLRKQVQNQKEQINILNEWLELYMPGKREPEDL